MIVVDQYLYLPGCCWFCKGLNKPILDTQMDIDAQNDPASDNPGANTRFYICADCAIEHARLVLSSRGLELNPLSSLKEMTEMYNDIKEQFKLTRSALVEISNAILTAKKVNGEESPHVPKDEGDLVATLSEVEAGFPLARKTVRSRPADNFSSGNKK